jgi:hypothetical protein
VKTSRRDADDLGGLTVDAYDLPQHVRSAAKSSLPPPVAHDGHRGVGCLRGPPDHRHDAEIAKEVQRHLFDVAARLGLAVEDDGGAIQAREPDDLRERGVVRAHRFEALRPECIERFPESQREPDLPHLDEAIGIAHRQRAEQQVVHEAEERRVGANPERQRQRDHSGEHRRFPEHAQRVLQVLQQLVDHVDPSLLAIGFSKHVRTAEPLQGQPPRVGRCETPAQTLVDQQFEVGRQLLVELAIEPLVTERRAAPQPRHAEPLPRTGHPSDLPFASTRPITAASRSQYSVCAISCLSPDLVIA